MRKRRRRVRVHRRAGGGGERRGARIVVGVAVRDEDRRVLGALAARDAQERVALRVVDRARIDRDSTPSPARTT